MAGMVSLMGRMKEWVIGTSHYAVLETHILTQGQLLGKVGVEFRSLASTLITFF